MTNDLGQRIEIDGQFVGHMRCTTDGLWEVRNRSGKAAGIYKTSEEAILKLTRLLERYRRDDSPPMEGT